MKKYKITIYNFNKDSQELESVETLITKPCDEKLLKDIIVREIVGRKHFGWEVNPRPKKFHERFK